EEILLEGFAVAQLRRERSGQKALAVNRALQGGDDRNAEIAEQAREVDDVCFHSLARFRAVELGKKEILHVDDRADAAFRNYSVGHGSTRSPDGAKRNPGIPHSASLHAGYKISAACPCSGWPARARSLRRARRRPARPRGRPASCA